VDRSRPGHRAAHRDDRRAPADLTPYIQALVPGDGERPCYADYDLRITYNQPYVEAMYKKAGGFLVAELFTTSGLRVEPEVVRGRTALPAITAETSILLDQLQHADCIVVDVDTLAGYDETTYRTRLATDTAYEARIRGGGLPDPVYRWTFVTSRYRTFAAHLPTCVPCRGTSGCRPRPDFTAIAAQLGPLADRAAKTTPGGAIWQGALGYPIRTLPERPEATHYWSEPAAFEARLLPLPARAALRVGPDRADTQAPRRHFVLTPFGRRPIVSWLDVPHRLVRSIDGARALLVPVDAAGQPVRLAPGSYRADFVFKLTGVPGLPDLSRQGETTTNRRSWSFSVPRTPDPLVDPEA
jgi:hypothetical protein